MNKQEFLSEIQIRLSGFPEDEIRSSVEYYSEMIEDRVEDGMTEEEAVSAVGSVDSAVKEIVDNIPLSKVIKAKAKPERKLKAWEIVLLAVGSPIWAPLLLAFIVILFSLYIVVWACVIAFFAADFAFLVSGLAAILCGIIALFRMDPAYPLLAIGAGLFLLGGGLMLIPPLIGLAKQTGKLGKTIVLWIKSWFVRGKKDA